MSIETKTNDTKGTQTSPSPPMLTHFIVAAPYQDTEVKWNVAADCLTVS